MASPIASAPRPTFWEAFRYWVRLGLVNFGGPAGQISMMHTDLVERRRWIGERDYLRALNFTMILPGPEAQQLATYVGWRLHGWVGGLVAGLWFILPSVFVLALLAYLVVAAADVPAVRGLLYGVQPVVVAVVVDALLRIGRRTLHHRLLVAVAGAAFVAIHFLDVAFPLIILAAAVLGFGLRPLVPRALRPAGHAAEEPTGPPARRPAIRRVFAIVGLFAVLWLLPLGGLVATAGPDDVLTDEYLFFTQAAFVTFGGAYAVLSYIADVAVNEKGWLTAPQMVQGLGFAESTPGPLIMVTEYVGFLGGWNHPGGHDALAWAIAAALVTVYATFLPCFLFIFAGAPYIEYLAGNRHLQAAFTAVTAAVVGVIANLALFFGTNVLWRGGLQFDLLAVAMAAVAFPLLRLSRVPMPLVVLAGALFGVGWELVGPGVPTS